MSAGTSRSLSSRTVNEPTTSATLGASYRFHLLSGSRVTIGLAAFQLVLLFVLLAFQPPAAREFLLKGLAIGIATPETLSAARFGLAVWAVLAAAWVGTPRTVIPDEPLDAMDDRWRRRIHGWLEAIREAESLPAKGTTWRTP